MNFKEWLNTEENAYGLFEAGRYYEDREQDAIAYAIMIANFYKDFKRMPSKHGSKEKLQDKKYNVNGEQVSELQLGVKLRNFRNAKEAEKEGKKSFRRYYPSADQAGENAGLPKNWMDVNINYANTLEQEAIKYAIMIANFYKDFERMPSKRGSKEKLQDKKYNFNGEQVSEEQLGAKLSGFRRSKKSIKEGKKLGKRYYPSAEKAGENAGLPKNWMDVKDNHANTLEQEAIKYAIMIANFYKDFERMPSKRGSKEKLQDKKYNFDGYQVSEEQLGNKLSTFRRAKKAIKEGKKSYVIYYKSADQAGENAGLPKNWMDVGYATPQKFVNHQELLRILKNLKLAENFNFQPEMVCFREGKRCLNYDGAYKDSEGNPIAVFEYQGEQHYHPTNLYGLRKFRIGAQNDSDKLKITRQNNIPLLSIPFWKKNQMESLVNEFMQAVLNAPNKKLSPSQWNHYAVDIATPDAKQQQIIDKEFCRYVNSPKGITDAAIAALYPEIQKKWKMCQKNQLSTSA